MTPAERAVVAAARDMEGPDDVQGWDAMAKALDALDAEQPPDGPTELEITWGQLVADDEMWSAKAGKWFTVLEARKVNDPREAVGETIVRLVGIGKPFSNPSNTPVRVRRSAMGQAVDLFATVLWSGPNGG